MGQTACREPLRRPHGPVRHPKPDADPADGVIVEGALAGYDTLSASQVVRRLESLGPEELTALQRYEASHRNRHTILNRAHQILEAIEATSETAVEAADEGADEGAAAPADGGPRRRAPRSPQGAAPRPIATDEGRAHTKVAHMKVAHPKPPHPHPHRRRR